MKGHGQPSQSGGVDLRAVHQAFLEGKPEAELARLLLQQARSIKLFSEAPASNDDDDDDDDLQIVGAPAAGWPGPYLRSISYDANGKVETHSLPDSRVHQPQRPLAPGFGTELEAMRRWCLVSAQLGHFTPVPFCELLREISQRPLRVLFPKVEATQLLCGNLPAHLLGQELRQLLVA